MDTHDRDANRSAEFSRELGRTISRLNRLRKRFMNDHLRQYGLSGSHYMFLITLHRHPGSSQDYLAERYYMDKGNVARGTKRLVELGYIRRETDPNDKRQNNLYLTKKGEEIVPYIYELLHEWSQIMAENLTIDECYKALELLDKMLENSSKHFNEQ
ncbi:MAG: MarR family transcriptional regulator [Clostridiales bacterium]|nr:MarR family transcriptional regulator [Clostridiales bacterium]